MKKVEAFECEYTNGIFRTDAQAARSEFKALMRKASNHLPAMGSIAPKDIFEWLGGAIDGEIYPLALPALMEALTYLRNNLDTINGRKERGPTLGYSAPGKK